MKNFLREFQAFISRGNVMDLAVAVIIGAAFSSIVNSLVKDILNPLLGFFVGRPDFTNLFIVLQKPANYAGPDTYEALTKAGATVFGYGAFLTAVVQFIILSFVIFWLIKVVVTARKKVEQLAGEEHKDAKTLAAEKEAKAAAAQAKRDELQAENVELLREIRDALKNK